MIFDRLQNHAMYQHLSPRFERAFRILTEGTLAEAAPGRYEVAGAELYAMVQEYDSRAPEETKWEAHRRYIDIQYMQRGSELMGFANLHTAVTGDYLAEKDYQALEAGVTGGEGLLEVGAGQFVIFFPEDAHRPGLRTSRGSEPVRKIVLKVLV